MANDRCIDAVIAQLKKSGKSFKAAEIQQIHDELNNLKSRIFSKGETANSPEFMKKAMEMVNEYRFQAQQAKRKSLMNLMTTQELMHFGTQDAFKGDPMEAVKAKLQGMTTRLSEGGNNSVDGTRQSMRAELLQELHIGLQDAGVDKMMANSMMDRDTMNELFHLRDGKSAGITGNPDAAKAAQVISGVNHKIIERLQAAGSSVREVVGYITRQAHDREKILGAGFEPWMSDIMPRLDQDKTFGNMGMREKVKMMADIFQDIKDGKYRSNVEQDVADQFITTSGKLSPDLAKKTSQSRSLHFQDGNAFFDYNQKYGNKNLIESVMSSIEAQSRNYALMTHLGTDPVGGLNGWIERMRDHYQEAGDDKSLSQLNDSHLQKKVDKLYDSVSGASDIPGQSMVAKVARGARMVEATSKLGFTAVQSLHDVSQAAAVIRSINGENVLSNALEMSKTYLSGFFNHEYRATLGGKLGIGIEDSRNDMLSQYGSTDPNAGSWSKIAQLTSRLRNKYSTLAGMPNHFDMAKLSTAKFASTIMADHIETAFPDLSPRMQSVLTRYGIGSEDWGKLGRAVEDLGDGTKGITPEGVKNIPEDLFDGGKKEKFALQDKVFQLLNEHGNIGSATVGPREKAWMGQDEGIGVLARLIGQFKTVPMMLANTAERIALSDPVNKPQGWGDVLRGKGGDLQGVAQFFALSTVMSYVGFSLKELAKGKTPPDANDPKIWLEAMARGGLGGVYGELLLGNNHNLAQAAAGPVLGTAFDAYDIARGSDPRQNRTRAAIGLAANNIPFQNLWFAKAAFDKYVVDAFQEMATPGYKQGLENSAAKHGQRYFMFAPTSNKFLGTK